MASDSNPFAAQDFVDAVTDRPTVLTLAATVLKDAAIHLNNEALALPEDEWRDARMICDQLSAMADAMLSKAVHRG